VEAPDEHFNVHLTPGDGAGSSTAIKVRGELDSASAQELLEAFESAVGVSETPEAMVDLAEVSFVDSAGMRGLILLERQASRLTISLTVIPPPAPVTQLLEIAGVAQRVNLVPDGRPPVGEIDFLERVDLELGVNKQAPRQARAAVRECLSGLLEDLTLANAVLMTSELVTNAVLYPTDPGAGPVGLRITAFPDVVRIQVDDPGQGFDPSEGLVPAGELPGPEEGGRGLFVVDRCASQWGARHAETDRGRRFIVWFELPIA